MQPFAARCPLSPFALCRPLHFAAICPHRFEAVRGRRRCTLPLLIAAARCRRCSLPLPCRPLPLFDVLCRTLPPFALCHVRSVATLSPSPPFALCSSLPPFGRCPLPPFAACRPLPPLAAAAHCRRCPWPLLIAAGRCRRCPLQHVAARCPLPPFALCCPLPPFARCRLPPFAACRLLPPLPFAAVAHCRRGLSPPLHVATAYCRCPLPSLLVAAALQPFSAL